MSEPELPCSNKLVFETREAANAAAILAEHQHNAKLKSYKCKHCDFWHLASAW